jgi:hypothetical protein
VTPLQNTLNPARITGQKMSINPTVQVPAATRLDPIAPGIENG